MDAKCFNCGKSGDEVRLQKCAICFKYFCDEHAYSMHGRAFCSAGCGDYFFFAEPED
ncbi:MAG TPA: hypothetical protein VJS92_12160 [Candidatus Polarisedimenticolaceae bacterium]|nr:hypothetical protein [Candidatus Polarisedimenticolaceae bacterium]